MTALVVQGNSGMPDDASPFVYSQGPYLSSGWQIATLGGTNLILLGVDITATGSGDIQLFCQVQINAIPFYYDSQSIGEGQGCTFAWRGQIPVHPNDYIRANLTAASSVTWGGYFWGYYLPRRGNG